MGVYPLLMEKPIMIVSCMYHFVHALFVMKQAIEYTENGYENSLIALHCVL